MFTSSFILTDGASLEIFAVGEGATTICTAHNFDVTTRHGGLALEAFANVTRTIGVNLRGMGGSSREADPAALSMVQAVRDLEAVRSAVGLKQWVFAGFSAGGFIGLHYALMYPRALQGLILIGTAPSYRAFLDPASVYCRKNPHYATVQRVQGTQRWSEVVWPLIAHRADLVERAGRHTGGISEDRQAAQVAEMPMYDLEPRLGEIRVPTLVIHGRHDGSMPLTQGTIIASAIHGSELVVLEESGHFPFWEQPREFEQVVAAFVRRVE